jgi:hypothetical protein
MPPVLLVLVLIRREFPSPNQLKARPQQLLLEHLT